MIFNDIPRPPKPNPNIKYIITNKERDGAYASLTQRQRRRSTYVYIKESWILEGQDREGAFIDALRKLYKTIEFPEVEMVELSKKSGVYKVVDEFKDTVKQLVGLPDFGPRVHGRDEKTLAVASRLAAEQPEKKRINTHQAMYNGVTKLTESTGPRHLCEVLRDAILGALNVFRMGYMVREIGPNNIAFNSSVFTDVSDGASGGYMLSKDGKSIEGKTRPFKGLIYDFTVCKALNEEKDQFTGDTEKLEITGSTPTPILSLKKRSEYVHMPTYDLKSFLWLLLYTATEIICDYASGKQKVKLDDPVYLAEKAKKEKKDSGSEDHKSGKDDADENIFRPSEEQTSEAIGDSGPEKEGQPKEVSAADVPMDVDSGNPSSETEANKSSGKDAEMGEVKDQPITDDEDDEKKRKRDNSVDSEERGKSKGKQKVTLETCEDEDENEGKSAKDGKRDEKQASSSETDEDLPSPHPGVWYHKPLGPGYMINILKPFEFKPPANFKPPKKGPEYVAFQEDRMAYVIHMLLKPSPQAAFFTARPNRGHLIERFEYFLFNSPGLKPFYPLALELLALNLRLFVPKDEVARGREYTRDDIELVFECYLEAFEKHMPEEENWYYLKEYEGPDVQYKFYHNLFLGAFASPTNYKPSSK